MRQTAARPLGLVALCLLAGAAAGCGSHRAAPAATTPPTASAPRVPLPPGDWFAFRGPLPGRPVHIRPGPFPIRPGSVRLVLTTGSGRTRVPLYLARSRGGHLCIGTSGIFRCFAPSDVNPVYALTVFSGRHGTVDWGAVVGFERPGVRTTIELQTPGQIALVPHRLPGFPFEAFASRVYRGNGSLPDGLRYFDGRGRELSGFRDLAFLWQPCPNAPAGCGASWRVGGDATTLTLGREAVGAALARDERAQAVALRDRRLRSLLDGRGYALVEFVPWLKQSGGRIGTVVEIHLAPPASYDADFPRASCAEHAAYAQSVVHYAVENVSQLDVSVDLRTRRVVGIEPSDANADDPALVVDPTRYRVVVPPHDAGGPDRGSCRSVD